MVKKGIAFAYLGVGACIWLAAVVREPAPDSAGTRVPDAVKTAKASTVGGPGEGPRQRARRADKPPKPLVTAEQVGRILRSGDEEERNFALGTSLPDLARRDPAGAAEMVAGLEGWAWREQALKSLAGAWAALDPAAAMTWVRSLPDAAERDALIGSICRQVALQDPAKAVELAGEGTSTELLGILVHLWAARDFASAADWVGHLPAGPEREAAYARLAEGRSQDFPAEAATLVAERMAPGELQEEAAISILHRWAITDAAAAGAWAERFPPGDFQARARDELAGVERYRVLTPR